MKVCCALATAALLVLSAMPVDAQTIYPNQRCRVYDDTAFTQIPGQCGTVVCPITRADCLRDLRGGRCIATRAGWGELNQRALAATVDGKRRSAGQRERIDVAVDAPRLLGVAEPE